jgi:formimidoylglutamate deiminase
MKLFARDALLPTGWARDVVLDIGTDGMLSSIDVAFTPPQDAERVQGPLIPGMPNVHSHAFQRALAGLTQRGGPAADDFWTWRTEMYRFLERVGPVEQEAIAAQLYLEMLKAGYTSVAEFHYLHHDPAGRPYANPAEMAMRIVAAASDAGIRLTLLPVFYAHSDFGGAAPTQAQRRFIHGPESFRALLRRLVESDDAIEVRVVGDRAAEALTTGFLGELCGAGTRWHRRRPATSTQQSSARKSTLASRGAKRVRSEWLLEHAGIDTQWCIVHATHMTPSETRSLAATGAVVGLCPTTEADLGDGVFRAVDYLAAGGYLGIGGDSHVGVDPFAELRMIESAQRLKRERRNVLAQEGESSGLHLFQTALAGGARALTAPWVRSRRAPRGPGRARFRTIRCSSSSHRLIFSTQRSSVRRAAGRARRHAGRRTVGDRRRGITATRRRSLARYRQTVKRLLA